MRVVQLGIKNLLLHKLRSMLTVTGVILGVGSVIAMLAIGEGSKQEALEQIRKLGATNVIIRSQKPSPSRDDEGSLSGSDQNRSYMLEYGLKYADLERLQTTLPTVGQALPVVLRVNDVWQAHRGLSNARILGTTPEFLDVKNLELHRGRFLTELDLHYTKNVAVLAAGAAERLFKFEDPIGRTVHLGTNAFRVIGVLRPQASGDPTPGGIGQSDFNRDIYIPMTSAQKRFGEFQAIREAGSRSYERTELHEITLTVKDDDLVTQTAAMARKVLLRKHPKGEDFMIQVPLELLRRAEQERRIWNLVLGSIAGISLLVGGIGIMNIMLANVTERTREIGIRRALGAKRRDIVMQFLVETILLSSAGGILGVVFGIGVPVIVSYYSDIPTVLTLWSILVAFGFSAITGVIFGIYPARRAALMDPIEALRHE